MNFPNPLALTLACAAATLAVALMSRAEVKPTAGQARKKIVFIAGNPSHGPGEHEHRAGCMLLAEHLNQSGLPIDAIVTTNGWPSDESIFDGAAAVIIYSDGGTGHPVVDHLASFKKLASQGVGIGCIHYAVEVPKGEAGSLFLDVIGGYFETDWSVNPHWDGDFKIATHPITRGISPFKMRDEWYYHMRFRKGMEGVTPILTDLPPAASLSRRDGMHSGNPEVRAAVLDRNEPQHVMWSFERPQALGGGRGFGFTGGHFHKNWQQDDFRRVVLNAITWAAKIEVPEQGVPSKTPTAEEMQANLDDKSQN